MLPLAISDSNGDRCNGPEMRELLRERETRDRTLRSESIGFFIVVIIAQFAGAVRIADLDVDSKSWGFPTFESGSWISQWRMR